MSVENTKTSDSSQPPEGSPPGRLDYRCTFHDPLDKDPPDGNVQTFHKSLQHVRIWAHIMFAGASHEAFVRVYESREAEISPIRTTKKPPEPGKQPGAPEAPVAPAVSVPVPVATGDAASAEHKLQKEILERRADELNTLAYRIQQRISELAELKPIAAGNTQPPRIEQKGTKE